MICLHNAERAFIYYAERIGADQVASRIAIFELGGEVHGLVVVIVDFYGDWRIYQFGGGYTTSLQGINVDMMGIIPSTYIDEFFGDIELEAVIISY